MAHALQLNSFWLIFIMQYIYKMNKCFKANWFQILGKTSWNFLVINKKYINLNRGYGNNKIKVVTTIFLGLQIKDKLEEKKHSKYHP
jgi:hypothetical protein